MATASRRKTARPAARRSRPKTGKAIVILSDGTGNSAAAVFKTNIWRLYKALDLSEKPAENQRRQIAYYDDGIGTSAFRPLALLGGTFGVGLKRNVLDLYRFICRTYEEGDEIYAFGFSRGAFTIRVTVGLLAQAGVLKFEKEDDLLRYSADAYRELRRQFTQNGWFSKLAAGEADKQNGAPAPSLVVMAFRGIRDWFIRRKRKWLNLPLYEEIGVEHRKPIDKIAFLGVFDTVAAYGMPLAELTRAIDDWIWPLSMPDYKLSPKVEAARHALALDDERDTFHPLVWDEQEEERLVAEKVLKRGRMKQVWFSGMHADVGGGYPDDSVAHVPLLWMIGEARDMGLRFDDVLVELLRKEASPFAPLHDSRRGLGSYYRLQPRKLSARLDPPDQRALIMQDPRLEDRGMLKSVLIHQSVFERVMRGIDKAAPIVLPPSYQVVAYDGTVGPGPESPKDASLRAERQEWVWNEVWKRRVIYFATVIVSAVVVIMPFVSNGPSICVGPQCLLSPAVSLFKIFVPASLDWWVVYYQQRPGLLLFFAALLLVLMVASSAFQRRMQDGMRRLWDMAIAGAGGQRQGDLTGDPSESRVYRLRTNAKYQRSLRWLKWRIIPDLFGVATLAIVINVAAALLLRFAMLFGIVSPLLCQDGHQFLWWAALCWLAP
jgi:uncharacterized protein (DUF2235 family)